jgi:hypothetical protein
VIKLLISDFDLGIGVFRIGDLLNPENTNSKFKITNRSFYHQLVISNFSSLFKDPVDGVSGAFLQTPS